MSPATRISEEEVKDLPKLEKGASDCGIFSIHFKATLRAAKKLYVIERKDNVVPQNASDALKTKWAEEAM
jgi:hypothetical protein